MSLGESSMTPPSTPTTVSFTYPALYSQKGAYLFPTKRLQKSKIRLDFSIFLLLRLSEWRTNEIFHLKNTQILPCFQYLRTYFPSQLIVTFYIICVHFTLIVAERVQCRSDQIFRNTPLNIVPLPSQDSSKPENASDTPPTSFIPNELNDIVEPMEQSNQEKMMTSQNNVSFGCPFLLWSKQLYYKYTCISRIKRFYSNNGLPTEGSEGCCTITWIYR